MKVLYITCDSHVSEEDIPNTLEELQAKVDGHIEVIVLTERWRLIINEEGKLRELPKNQKATRLFQSFCYTNDFVAGNAVVTAVDASGEDFESLSPGEILIIRNAI